MAFVALPAKLWMPNWHFGIGDSGSYPPAVADNFTMDADEEECQWIGRVFLAAGSGTKTFGGGSSAIGWMSGASVAFVATATLRIGCKSSAVIDTATGPAGRATIGAAAFSAYTDLTGGGGGSNVIASTTWRDDTIGSGTPFSVTHGDLIAICWHLETTAGVQSVKLRTIGTSAIGMPTSTLVTSGPTYSQASLVPNAILTFSDGTLGWLEGSWPHSVGVSTEIIGNTNIYGNVFELPFACKVDAVMEHLTTSGTTNYTAGLWSDPNGTPTAMTNGTVSVDPQILGGTAMQVHMHPLPATVELAANTEYLVGALQNSASAITASYFGANAWAHMQASGAEGIGGANGTCYAAKSTAGGAVSIGGVRRAGFYVRISEIDVSAAASSGSKFIG